MPVKTAKSKFRLGHLAITVLCACLSTFDTLHSQSSPIVRAVTTTELSHTKTNIEQVSMYDFNFIGKNKKKPNTQTIQTVMLKLLALMEFNYNIVRRDLCSAFHSEFINIFYCSAALQHGPAQSGVE